MMKSKGRVRIGADADLIIFDSIRIKDKSTYEHPANFSEGIKFAIVGGTFVENGRLQKERLNGQPIRAPIGTAK